MKRLLHVLLYPLVFLVYPLSSEASPVNDTGVVKRTTETAIGKMKNQVSELKKISFTDAYFSMNSFCFCQADSMKGYSSASLQGMLGVELAGVPLQLQYNWQINRPDRWSQRQSVSYPKLSFNATAFQQKLAGRLQSLAKPEEWLGDQYSIIEKLKAGAMSRLWKEIEHNTGLESNMFRNAFPGGWDMISSIDKTELQKRLLEANSLQPQTWYADRLSSLQDSVNQQLPIDENVFKTLLSSSRMSASIEKAAAIIAIVRQGWQESGLTSTLQSMEADKANAFRQLLLGSPRLRKGLAGRLNLSQMERLFLNINRFTMGAAGFQQGHFGLDQSFLVNSLGLDLMMKNNAGLSFTGGVLPGAQSLYEQTLGGVQIATAASGFQYSKPNPGSGGYSIGVMTYNVNNSNILGLPGAASLQKQLVFSVEKNIVMGKSGNLSLGLSRVMNTAKKSTDIPVNMSSATGLPVEEMGGFFNTLAFKADYSNEYKGATISHEAGILFSGLGYSNPGNGLMSPGSNEFSHALSARFFKGKLSISTRNNFRYYLLDVFGDHFFTQSHSIDARLRLPKGNSVSVRYRPSMSKRSRKGVSVDAFRSERFSLDANIKLKTGQWLIRHFSTLAFSTISLPAGTGGLTKTGNLELNSSETFTKGQSQYYINHSWTHGFTKSTVMPISNSSLMAEAGMLYGASNGNIQLSSGCGYQKVSGWYSQLFVRQSINGSLFQNIQVQASFNLGAILDKQTAWPVQNCRSEITLLYQFSKLNR